MAPKKTGQGAAIPTPPSTVQKKKKTGTPGPSTTGNKDPKPSNIPSPDRAPRNPTNAGVRKQTPRSRSRPLRRTPPQPKRNRDPEFTDILKAQNIQVYWPNSEEYEIAVASSNLLYRFSRPTYVIQPQTKEHVMLIVKEAVQKEIPITIKNGGHSYIGSSFPNDGILLDLKRMKNVTLEKDEKIMIIEGGALWGNVYRTLVDEGEGLMVNGGRCPSVGVSGFLLGGGIGPFSRSYGMAVDNLEEVSIVTADGELYVVRKDDDEDSDNGMLFWALAGAGGGNFGVVVEVKVGVHELKDRGQEITAGRHTWFPSIDRSREGLLKWFAKQPRPDESSGMLATMNHFYTTDWPDQMTIDTSWFSDLEVQNGDLAVRFLTYFDGNQEDFNRLIHKGVLNAELSKQLTRRSLPELSSRFLHETLFAQWDEDTKRSTPANTIIKEELEAFKRLFTGEAAGLCQVSFIHAGGEMTRRKPEATAFRWRETIFHTYIMIQWKDKWLERDMRGFARKFKNRLQQFSIFGKAAFVNFPDSSLPRSDHMKAYYGNNRQKLQQVKRLWDEHNFFKWDQGIDLAEKYDDQARDMAELEAGIREEVMSEGEGEGPDEQTDLAATMRWEARNSTADAPLLTSSWEAQMWDYVPGDNTPW